MSVAAIIVTYNRIKELERSINNIMQQTEDIEIIHIINNNSDDGTKEFLDTLELIYPKIKPHHLSSNKGGAYGFWLGIKKALDSNTEFLWIMDDDCFPDTDCLKNLLEGFETDRVMAVSPVVLCVNGEIDLQHRRKVIYPAIHETYIPKEEYEKLSPIECESSSFVGPVFRKEIFDLIGLPRNDLFFQFDDTEFFARIKKNNYESIMSLSAFVIHGGSKSFPADLLTSPTKTYYSIRNKIIVGLQYNKFNYKFLYFIARDCVKFLKALIKQRFNILQSIKSIYGGVRDGIQNKLGKIY